MGWEAWSRVSLEVMMSGFVKADLVPHASEESLDSQTETNDSPDSRLTPELAALFESDTDDEDFEGFPDTDITDL